MASAVDATTRIGVSSYGWYTDEEGGEWRRWSVSNCDGVRVLLLEMDPDYDARHVLHLAIRLFTASEDEEHPPECSMSCPWAYGGVDHGDDCPNGRRKPQHGTGGQMATVADLQAQRIAEIRSMTDRLSKLEAVNVAAWNLLKAAQDRVTPGLNEEFAALGEAVSDVGELPDAPRPVSREAPGRDPTANGGGTAGLPDPADAFLGVAVGRHPILVTFDEKIDNLGPLAPVRPSTAMLIEWLKLWRAEVAALLLGDVEDAALPAAEQAVTVAAYALAAADWSRPHRLSQVWGPPVEWAEVAKVAVHAVYREAAALLEDARGEQDEAARQEALNNAYDYEKREQAEREDG